MELRPYGKNTKNYLSNEPKMSSAHTFFAEIQLFEGRDLKNLIFQKNCSKFSRLKKKNQKNGTKIEDQEEEAGKIFLNTTSADLLYISSLLGSIASQEYTTNNMVLFFD